MTTPTTTRKPAAKPVPLETLLAIRDQQIAHLEKEVNRLKKQAVNPAEALYEHDMCYRGSEFPTATIQERHTFPFRTGVGSNIHTARPVTPIGEILEKIVPQRK